MPEWLERLTEQFMTAAFYIDLLADNGVLLDDPYTRQLDGKLGELRFHLDRQAARITYFIAGQADHPADRIHKVPDARRTGNRPRQTSTGHLSGGNAHHPRRRAMSERTSWTELRDKRMAEPGAADAYRAAAIACELGRAVRELRVERGWSQRELAEAAHMTQSAVARFDAGGTVPSLPVLHRIADALDADLTVTVPSRHHAA